MSIDTEETDRATVHVARSRDDDFVAFVETAGPYLYRTAYLLAGDRYRAEDLVQTAFERTYRVWDRVRDREPRAYARRILVNQRIDTWRHIRREVLPGDDHIPVRAAMDGSGEVALRDALVRALARLAPQQRRVVVLRHLLDLSEADVAAELGRSVGTVKATNARALERLRGLVAGADLEVVDAPVVDADAVLRGSRAALRRRRVAQGATSGVAALLLVWFLLGPVRVPGLGEVALPGSEWFREVTGIERLLEDQEPAPGLTAAPTVPAVEVEPLPETFAVPGDDTSTATLAEDGSYFMVKTFPGSGEPGTPEAAGTSVVDLVEIQEDGIAHAGEYMGSGTVDGRDAVILAAVRQGDRLAWAESPVVDGGDPAVWAIRVSEGAAAPVTVVEHRAAARSADDELLGDPWVGLTAGRVVWLTTAAGPGGDQVRTLSAKDAGGVGAEQVVATAVRTFATHDDEVLTTAVARGSDGGTRHVITSFRDDGRTEVVRRAPAGGGEGSGWGGELAASDTVVAWNDGATVHVLDRGTGRERTFEPGTPRGVVTSIDVAGGDVVWSTAHDDGNTAYLAADALGDGRPEVLAQGEGLVSVAIAGDLVAWRVEAADTGTAVLHRARFER
ncbi:SigE family RNA polymerase sigma factor [Promicromonospora iranensis]|uniref:RNA polymerase sigma-70 factor (Sigma-E family) n=1 Tax=Promicromonospora iranensis TaxID=1105144 RepID=A0ABU2CU61_9MICO|nr:SigE family RNA polymerase sigma factor [Promicromonospora iranensis]MDR7384868.1 RNA polymerase sigma-70 factor (sigma-E family) [Promicromonospora iranensis]